MDQNALQHSSDDATSRSHGKSWVGSYSLGSTWYTQCGLHAVGILAPRHEESDLVQVSLCVFIPLSLRDILSWDIRHFPCDRKKQPRYALT